MASFPLHDAAVSGNMTKLKELINGGENGRGIRLKVDDEDRSVGVFVIRSSWLNARSFDVISLLPLCLSLSLYQYEKLVT